MKSCGNFLIIVLSLLAICHSQEVILPKNQGPLGFSIIGGTDHSCVPFGAHDPGIFISHVSIPINSTIVIKMLL
jgi:hypothetical protein